MAAGGRSEVEGLWMVYLVGIAFALWRTDAGWTTKIAVAILWPLGPLAFLVTVAILLAASLIAFPLVAGAIGVAGALALWWLFS